MKKLFLIPFMALLMAGAALAQTANTPDGMIKQVVDQVMSTVKSDKAIQSGDLSHISALVEKEILPHTDFQRTTRLTMGPSWRDATPAQRQQITEQFKQLLIRTYSGAIAQIRNQTVEFLPLRMQPGDTDTVVRTQVMNNGQPVQIDYRLEKTASGEWKVYDINVLGAWLIQAYQGQFREQVARGGVQGLLTFLSNRNAQLAAGKQQ